MTKFVYDQRLQLKEKHIVVKMKPRALPNSDITGLVLKTPHSKRSYTRLIGYNYDVS